MPANRGRDPRDPIGVISTDRNTRVKLDEPSMYRHGLRTPETERSNVNHIVDMINIEMFTIEDYSISRDDRTWFS